MESVLTVRLDGSMKEQATMIMRRHGYSPSTAVRRLFEYTVKHDDLPFGRDEKPSKEEIRRRVAAFDACHTKEPLLLNDDEIRDGRLGERYGFNA